MVRKMFLVLILLFATFSFGADDYNKDIVVKNQSRNDKVKTVFKEMMNAYEEEDIGQFFSYVSEDRFEQDYMTFYDAIDEDIRVYDILNVDTWVNKITEDGVKRFLYVQWEKRYLATSNDTEINQRGYSRFLFDEVNGKYKLIQLAGNNFWGKSLPEWTEEVPQIAGQVEEVKEDISLADLIIVSAISDGSTNVTTIVKNQGQADISAGTDIKVECGGDSNIDSGGLQVGSTVTIITNDYYAVSCTVDPDGLITEEDTTNNTAPVTGAP